MMFDFTPRRTPILTAFITALILCCLAYIAFFSVFFTTWYSFKKIAHHGQPIFGKIIEKQPMNHDGVRFEYLVNGATYYGEAPAGMNGLPKYDQIQIGDLIPIKYREEKPSESIAGDAENAYKTISFLLFGLLPGGCLVLGVTMMIGLRLGTTFTWLDLINYLRKAKS
jgi:hypothetical protein